MICSKTTLVRQRSARKFSTLAVIGALAVVVALVSSARAADTLGTGAFTKLSALASDLKRGTSKKMDVRRVLGTPKGSGQALFPMEHLQREVWYYEDTEYYLNEAKSDDKGVLHVPVRFQMLQVYFDGDVFDGYMWVTNTQTLAPR